MKRGVVVNQEFSIYVGLDWGTEFHRACVLDASGEVVRECKVDHSGKAITDFVRLLNAMIYGKPECIAVAVEVPPGPPQLLKLSSTPEEPGWSGSTARRS
jgi:hypothetical protein